MILAANAVAILVVLVYVYMERRPLLAGIAGGFIVGGSLGNVIQRLTGDGHVTDFLKFPYWPNFNLSDVFIVLGIVIVFLGLLVEADPRPPRRAQDPCLPLVGSGDKQRRPDHARSHRRAAGLRQPAGRRAGPTARGGQQVAGGGAHRLGARVVSTGRSQPRAGCSRRERG